MHGDQELDSLESLLSSITRSGLRTLDGHGVGQERMRTGAGQAMAEMVIAGHHNRPDIEARLERMEIRLKYVDVSLSHMEVSRNYIKLRLEDAAEDVAYAGDTALAFEEVRRLYADPTRHLPERSACWHGWTPPKKAYATA